VGTRSQVNEQLFDRLKSNSFRAHVHPGAYDEGCGSINFHSRFGYLTLWRACVAVQLSGTFELRLKISTLYFRSPFTGRHQDKMPTHAPLDESIDYSDIEAKCASSLQILTPSYDDLDTKCISTMDSTTRW
jgi:hypothetical protein